MHSPTMLLTAVLALASVTDTTAQVVGIRNTGCFDKSMGEDGPPITVIGGTNGEPIVPVGGIDPTFGLQVQCEVSPTSAALFIWGACGTPGALPTFNWPTTDPCFSSWLVAPTNCNGTVQTAVVYLLDGALADPTGMVTFPFPLIDLRPAVDLVQLSRTGGGFCVQFLCLDFSSSTPCTAVSQGARFVLSYS